MRKLLLLLAVVAICVGCDPDFYLTYRVESYWWVKNNTTQTDLYVVSPQRATPIYLPARDSVIIYQQGTHYNITCEWLYLYLLEKNGGQEPSCAVYDLNGNLLKNWRMSELDAESHHFFDVQSWSEYCKSNGEEREEDQHYIYRWVFEITNEDL